MKAMLHWVSAEAAKRIKSSANITSKINDGSAHLLHIFLFLFEVSKERDFLLVLWGGSTVQSKSLTVKNLQQSAYPSGNLCLAPAVTLNSVNSLFHGHLTHIFLLSALPKQILPVIEKNLWHFSNFPTCNEIFKTTTLHYLQKFGVIKEIWSYSN